MRVGVVVSCYRQERFLARTVAALERALEGVDWQGVVELASPAPEPLPALSGRWQVVSSWEPATGQPRRPLTPGAGRMVGLDACAGDWVLFVDSDMELDAAWVRAAIAATEREARLGGIGGRIEEWFEDGAVQRPGPHHDMYGTGDRDRFVGYLANVAFYRREALLAAGGYDVRLSSDEDFELGMRMRWLGWQILSLGMRAGRHWSAPRPSFRELSRRWRTGLCFGQGQVLRLYLGRRGFGTLLGRQWLYVATMSMWLLGALAVVAALVGRSVGPLGLWALVPLGVLALMTVRKRSPRLALHSLLTWTLNGLGMITGLLRPLPAAEAAEGAARTSRAGDAPC